MARSLFPRLLWSLPAAAGLALGQVSCGGSSAAVEPGYYPSTFVVSADLNGDGRPDLVDAIFADGGNYAASGYVSTRLQHPTQAGIYLPPVQSEAGPNPANLVAAPLVPGGAPGLVVVNRQLVPTPSANNTVSVLYPDPARPGGFLAPVALPVGARKPQDVAVGDLDGDTWPDVVVAADGASSVQVFRQLAPGGSFAAPVSLPVAGAPTAVALADLDGDGRLDIIAACAGDQVSILLQNTDGSFQAHQDLPVGSNPVCVKVADLRKLGRRDLLVATRGTDQAPTTQGLSVLLQNDDHSYAPVVRYDVGDAFASWLAVGDLDQDGLPDVAVANAGAPGDPGSVAVLRQDRDHPGTFLAPVRYGGIQGPTSVAIVDVDGDGLPDLAIGDGVLVVRFQVTGAPGTFGLPYQYRQ